MIFFKGMKQLERYECKKDFFFFFGYFRERQQSTKLHNDFNVREVNLKMSNRL